MKNWRIAAWRSTEFRLHPAYLIFLIYAAMTDHLIFASIATASILFHEGAHAAVAALCGQPLRSIELTPLGAILMTNDTERQPFLKRILIIAAGPIASCSLCMLSIFLMKRQGLSQTWCRLLFISNLSILLMNLIPAYPLDGGRLLALSLEPFFCQRLVHQIMHAIGVIVGVVLIALNIYSSWMLGGWNLSLALAGCCLIHSAHIETSTWAMTELRRFLDRKIMLEKNHICPISVKYVLSTVPLTELIRILPPRKLLLYYCIEPGSMKVLGCLTEMEIIHFYLKTPALTLGQAQKMSQNNATSSKYDTN